MTKREIIEKFRNGTITGDDLLNLPYTNRNEAGRVLVEIYYCLLDANEARVLYETDTTVDSETFTKKCNHALACTNRTIAETLELMWEEDI